MDPKETTKITEEKPEEQKDVNEEKQLSDTELNEVSGGCRASEVGPAGAEYHRG